MPQTGACCELGRCEPVEARVRSYCVVQRGSRTPIGPFVGSFCIGFIRGSSATSSFIRRSTRLMAAFSVALWTDRRPGDGWRSLPGCSIALHV